MEIFTKLSSSRVSGTLFAGVLQVSLLFGVATSGFVYSQDSEARTSAARGGVSTARVSSGGVGSSAFTNLALGAALGSMGTHALSGNKGSSKGAEAYAIPPEEFFVEEYNGENIVVKGVEHFGPSEWAQNDLHNGKEKFRVCSEGKLRRVESNPTCIIKHDGFWKAKSEYLETVPVEVVLKKKYGDVVGVEAVQAIDKDLYVKFKSQSGQVELASESGHK